MKEPLILLQASILIMQKTFFVQKVPHLILPLPLRVFHAHALAAMTATTLAPEVQHA